MQPGFAKRVGNRWMFALEFEINGDIPRTWSELRGSLWLWAGGRLIGNLYEIETVKIGLDSLVEAAGENRAAASRILAACTRSEALKSVMWARYGEDRDPPVRLGAVDQSTLFSLEILPRRTGPFFDGWEAILFDDGAEEHFIFREGEAETMESVWPMGTFGAVIAEARTEFERLAQSIEVIPIPTTIRTPCRRDISRLAPKWV